jgi:hypothetical protein
MDGVLSYMSFCIILILRSKQELCLNLILTQLMINLIGIFYFSVIKLEDSLSCGVLGLFFYLGGL